MAETTQSVQFNDGDARLFQVDDRSHARFQKLKGVVLKSGGKRWYLDGVEIPHILADSAVFKMLRGRHVYITMTLEVELELVDEEDDPQGS